MGSINTPRAIAVCAALAAGWGAAPAQAVPQPCAGMAFTDPAGDTAQTLFAAPSPGAGVPAGDNLDLTGAFFNRETTAEGEVWTANLRVAELSLDMPEHVDAIAWFQFWDSADGTTHYLRAKAYQGSPWLEYDFGHVGPPLITDAAATGRVFPGKDGVVQIVLPGEAIPAAWSMNDLRAETRVFYRGESGGAIKADEAVSPGNHTFAACPAAAQPASSAAARETGQAAPLAVRLVTRSLKRGRRELRVRLSAIEPVARVRATLKREGAVVGSGRVSALTGDGVLRVKARRALRRGTYALELTGHDQSGHRRSASFRIRVR